MTPNQEPTVPEHVRGLTISVDELVEHCQAEDRPSSRVALDVVVDFAEQKIAEREPSEWQKLSTFLGRVVGTTAKLFKQPNHGEV